MFHPVSLFLLFVIKYFSCHTVRHMDVISDTLSLVMLDVIWMKRQTLARTTVTIHDLVCGNSCVMMMLPTRDFGAINC